MAVAVAFGIASLVETGCTVLLLPLLLGGVASRARMCPGDVHAVQLWKLFAKKDDTQTDRKEIRESVQKTELSVTTTHHPATAIYRAE